MDRFPRTSIGCLGVAFFACFNTAVAQNERNVRQIQFDGLETISSDAIVEKLASLPEVYEATHPSIDEATFVYRVREAVARGMLASGFIDAHVEISSDSMPIKLVVDEGLRYRRGPIQIADVSPTLSQWIESQLTTASPLEEDSIPVWRVGQPANGTLFGGMARIQAIRNRLTEVGLNGDGAEVAFERDEQALQRILVIELHESDRTFEIPAEIQSATPAAKLADGQEQDSETIDGPRTQVALELDAIYQGWFAQPTPGLHTQLEDKGLSVECWCGKGVVLAELRHQGHTRTIAFRNGEVQFGMPDPPVAIRVPVPNASVLILQKSTEEVEDNKTMSIKVDGSMSSDSPDSFVQFGFVFTPAAWQQWFPPNQTERHESSSGTVYEFEDHQLRVDAEGEFVELKGSDAAGRWFSVNAVPEEIIVAQTTAAMAVARPVEIFSLKAGEDHAQALRDIFEENDDGVDDEFSIPLASGQRDVFGALVLVAVNDGRLVDPDSLVGRIAKLYALELSRNRRTLVTRLTELEPEVLRGAVSSAVMGDLVMRQGNGGVERALRYFRNSQRLLNDSDAIEYDVELLLDPANLLGQVCQQIDFKQWIKASTQLVGPWVGESFVAYSDELVGLLPDDTSEATRLHVGRTLLQIAYAAEGRTMLDSFLTQRITSLELRKERLASKKDAKDKKER